LSSRSDKENQSFGREWPLRAKADASKKFGYDRLAGVVSTGRCNTCLKLLCRCMILQGLSGALVELACDGAEFGLAEA